MLSRTAEYALRAVLFLADSGAPANVDQIAERLRVPRNYLSKTLHRLAREGVLASTRGQRGGFRLARDPDRLSLLEVVEPFDPIRGERRCLLGRPQCSDANPCPAHSGWKAVSDQVAAFFRDKTVGDLLRGEAALSEPQQRRGSSHAAPAAAPSRAATPGPPPPPGTSGPARSRVGR